MFSKRIVYLIAFFVCLGTRVWPVAASPVSALPSAATYYVSSSAGDDDNDGLSQASPLATVARVNELSLQPGDRVLFKCGDSYPFYRQL